MKDRDYARKFNNASIAILNYANELLNEDTWLKYEEAKDINGDECSITHSDVAQFSFMGAVKFSALRELGDRAQWSNNNAFDHICGDYTVDSINSVYSDSDAVYELNTIMDIVEEALFEAIINNKDYAHFNFFGMSRNDCLLYTSPSPRDRQKSRMPSSA